MVLEDPGRHRLPSEAREEVMSRWSSEMLFPRAAMSLCFWCTGELGSKGGRRVSKETKTTVHFAICYVLD